MNNEKKGFTVPLEKWLREDLKSDFLETILDTPFYGEKYINTKLLHTMVYDFFEEKRVINPWGLWHLYAWQKWAIYHDLIE